MKRYIAYILILLCVICIQDASAFNTIEGIPTGEARTQTRLNLTDASNQVTLDSDDAAKSSIITATPTDHRTWTLPNASGTVAVSASAPITLSAGGDAGLTTPLALIYGGSANGLTASAGGLIWTDADSMEVLAGTTTALRMLQSGNAATPAWSTATYPATTTINQLLYSSADNTVAGLTTGNSGLLVTSGGGVPSIGTDIPTAVTIGSGYVYRSGGTDVSLLDGGTNASLTASKGGLVYSTDAAFAVLAATATAGQIPRSAANDAPAWSTATYPGTIAAGAILGGTAENVIGAITDLPTATTIGSGYIYRAGGTDVSQVDGGLGGDMTAATDGQIPIGDTGVGLVLGTLTGTANETEITNGAASITVGIPTAPVLTGPVTSTLDDAVNTGVTDVSITTHTTSGTPAAGIGAGQEFITETTAGNNEIGNVIQSVSTDVTGASEDFDLVIKGMTAGATATEKLRLLSTGTTKFNNAYTLPASMTINQILYASAADTVAGLATGNSGVLVTGATGIPAIGTDIPGGTTIAGGKQLQPGITWTSRTSTADNSWVPVVYGNGLFVAASSTGTNDRVMTSPDGITWTTRTSAPDAIWKGLAYGNGLFVAVAIDGPVMTSPDGITWTSRTPAATKAWRGVAYGNGIFVAVGAVGTGDRVMTSPDGITWTSRTSAADNEWYGVTYGNGLFVAVAITGVGNRVMTSPDGITWTIRTSAADNEWYGVTYGNGLFVAVSVTGTGNRVMTSPDGITWTSRTSAADNDWYGVTYGNGLFVAVSVTGTGNRVMTSPDGITWTIRTSAANNYWYGVTYGDGIFVAVAYTGTGNRVMTSPDGITWTIRTSVPNNDWRGITYGNGLFVSVSNSGTGDRVMTSGVSNFNEVPTNNIFQANRYFTADVGVGTTTADRRLHAESESAATNTITKVERLTSTSSGTPAAGIGVGIELETETAVGNNEIGNIIDSVSTDVSAGSEDFDLVVKGMAAGAAAAERFRVISTGDVKPALGYQSSDGSAGLSQDLVVKGSDGNNCTLTFKDGLLTAETCP